MIQGIILWYVLFLRAALATSSFTHFLSATLALSANPILRLSHSHVVRHDAVSTAPGPVG